VSIQAISSSSSSINLETVFKHTADSSIQFLFGLLETLQRRVTMDAKSNETNGYTSSKESIFESKLMLLPTATEKCLEEINHVMDSIRESLKCLHEYGLQYMSQAARVENRGESESPILSDELTSTMLSMLMDETSLWLSRRYVHGLSSENAEVYEVHY
jgi:hypothetical protein